MSEYDNTNSGVLFKNDEKTAANPKWADYKGTINVDGTEFWLSAWIKESNKDGKKFMSLAIRPKEDAPKGNSKRGRQDADEDIPF